MPSRTVCRLSTSTLSPLARPPATSASLPALPAAPALPRTVTARVATRPPASTTLTEALPLASRASASCGTLMACSSTPPAAARARTCSAAAGRQDWEGGAQRHGAGGLGDRDVGEGQPARVRVEAAIFRAQPDLGAIAGSAQPAGGQFLLEAQQLGARLRHVDVDGREVVDGGQRAVRLAVTSAPAVTLDLPMRPEIGAWMRVRSSRCGRCAARRGPTPRRRRPTWRWPPRRRSPGGSRPGS